MFLTILVIPFTLGTESKRQFGTIHLCAPTDGTSVFCKTGNFIYLTLVGGGTINFFVFKKFEDFVLTYKVGEEKEIIDEVKEEISDEVDEVAEESDEDDGATMGDYWQIARDAGLFESIPYDDFVEYIEDIYDNIDMTGNKDIDIVSPDIEIDAISLSTFENSVFSPLPSSALLSSEVCRFIVILDDFVVLPDAVDCFAN